VTSSWHIAVLGPGGVGGLLGGLLSRAGHDVEFVATPATAAALNGHGLSVHSRVFGDFTVPARAVESLAKPVDACLVTVKATGLDAARERVSPAAVSGAVVVPFLNGLDHLAVLRNRYPRADVVAATISVEATRVSPGVIEHTSPFANVEIAGADEFAAVLRASGPPVSVVDGERQVLWRKLARLAPLALLTSYAEAPIGVVRDRYADLLRDVVQEVATVARADGADVSDDDALQFLLAAPAAMKSSMQRDIESGRSFELDAIGGAVLRAAERHEVEAPSTRRLVEAIVKASIRSGPASGSGAG